MYKLVFIGEITLVTVAFLMALGIFQTIDGECVKRASPARTSVYVKAFLVNVNKCLKPFFLEQHINIVNTVTLQSLWFICRFYLSFDTVNTINRDSYMSARVLLNLLNELEKRDKM